MTRIETDTPAPPLSSKRWAAEPAGRRGQPRCARRVLVSGGRSSSSGTVIARSVARRGERLKHLELRVECAADPSAIMSTLNTRRSEEHTSELQSLMRTSYAVFCVITDNQTSYQAIANQNIKQHH